MKDSAPTTKHFTFPVLSPYFLPFYSLVLITWEGDTGRPMLLGTGHPFPTALKSLKITLLVVLKVVYRS